MGFWVKSVVIFNSIHEYGKQSIRRLAAQTGLSKSSVHRHLQAIDCRDRYLGLQALSPSSRIRHDGDNACDPYSELSFWKTQPGQTCLIRLVVVGLALRQGRHRANVA
jgi:hypothetical protein